MLALGRDDDGVVRLPSVATGKAFLGQATQETTQETAPTTQETTRERVLALLRTQPAITRRELANRLGLSDSGVKYHLEKLKAAEIIRHIGTTKLGYWEVLK